MLDDGDDANDMRAHASPDRGVSVPRHPLPSTLHLTLAGEPTSPLLCLKKRRNPHQAVTSAEAIEGDQDVDMDAEGEHCDNEQERRIEDTACGGRDDNELQTGKLIL